MDSIMQGMYVAGGSVRPMTEFEKQKLEYERKMHDQPSLASSREVLPIPVSLQRLDNVSGHLADCIGRLRAFFDRAVGCNEVCGGREDGCERTRDSLADELEWQVDRIARQVAELDRQIDRTRTIA